MFKMTSEEDISRTYRKILQSLKANSKTIIMQLTMIAEQYVKYAKVIHRVILQELKVATLELKLPILYLIDSIVKKVKKEYLKLFSEAIPGVFVEVLEQVDEQTRKDMLKLRSTWNGIFPVETLTLIDQQCHGLDSSWPNCAARVATKIHINPEFVKKQIQKTAAPAVSSAGLWMVDNEMLQKADFKTRYELLKKQQQIFDLEIKKTQLEQLMLQMPTVPSTVASAPVEALPSTSTPRRAAEEKLDIMTDVTGTKTQVAKSMLDSDSPSRPQECTQVLGTTKRKSSNEVSHSNSAKINDTPKRRRKSSGARSTEVREDPKRKSPSDSHRKDKAADTKTCLGIASQSEDSKLKKIDSINIAKRDFSTSDSDYNARKEAVLKQSYKKKKSQESFEKEHVDMKIGGRSDVELRAELHSIGGSVVKSVIGLEDVDHRIRQPTSVSPTSKFSKDDICSHGNLENRGISVMVDTDKGKIFNNQREEALLAVSSSDSVVLADQSNRRRFSQSQFPSSRNGVISTVSQNSISRASRWNSECSAVPVPLPSPPGPNPFEVSVGLNRALPPHTGNVNSLFRIPPSDKKHVEALQWDRCGMIPIDGVLSQVRFYGDSRAPEAVVVKGMHGEEPRTLSFKGNFATVIIDENREVKLPIGRSIKLMINDKQHWLRIGAPTRELYIDGKHYQVRFGGDPVSTWIDGRLHSFRLVGPPLRLEVGQNIRNDLLAGTVTLYLNRNTAKTLYLDDRMQLFDVNGFAVVMQFIDNFHRILLNGKAFPVAFGGPEQRIRTPSGNEFWLKFGSVDHPSLLRSMGIFCRYKDQRSAPRPSRIGQYDVRPPPDLLQRSAIPFYRDQPPPAVTCSNSGSSKSLNSQPNAKLVSEDQNQTDGMNVQDLYSQLLKAGIISGAESEKQNSNPSLAVGKMQDKAEQVEDSEWNALTERNHGLIQSLFTEYECGSCGLRFTEPMSNHEIPKAQSNTMKFIVREWYYTLSEWVQTDLMIVQSEDKSDEGLSFLSIGNKEARLCQSCNETARERESNFQRIEQEIIFDLQGPTKPTKVGVSNKEAHKAFSNENEQVEEDEVLIIKEGKPDPVVVDIDLDSTVDDKSEGHSGVNPSPIGVILEKLNESEETINSQSSSSALRIDLDYSSMASDSGEGEALEGRVVSAKVGQDDARDRSALNVVLMDHSYSKPLVEEGSEYIVDHNYSMTVVPDEDVQMDCYSSSVTYSNIQSAVFPMNIATEQEVLHEDKLYQKEPCLETPLETSVIPQVIDLAVKEENTSLHSVPAIALEGNIQLGLDAPVSRMPLMPAKIKINIQGFNVDPQSPKESTRLSCSKPSQDETNVVVNPASSATTAYLNNELDSDKKQVNVKVDLESINVKPRLRESKLIKQGVKMTDGEISGLCTIC